MKIFFLYHLNTKLENTKYLDLGLKPEELIQEINKFNPEFIGSDPIMLRQLAYLKKIGQGEDIQPTCIFSGGSVLDSYTKNYVENAFNTKIIDTYGTTEGGPLAFQCINGNYHVNSDFVYLEFLDDYNDTGMITYIWFKSATKKLVDFKIQPDNTWIENSWILDNGNYIPNPDIWYERMPFVPY